MASSPSPLLKLELMADGENENTWGQKTNTNETLIENAIAKRVPLTLGSSDVTLTDTQYADNQARSLCLACTGTLSANVNIVVPSRSKMYLVENATSASFTVTVKTAGGAGVACPQGQTTVVYCNGTNVVGVGVTAAVDASTLDGLDSTAFARLASRNQFSAGNSTVVRGLTDAATVDIDTSTGNVYTLTLGGNRTVTISNAQDGSWIELYIKQDGTGSRTISWPANIIWRGGAAPTLSTSANTTDAVRLRYVNALSSWYGDFSNNLSSGGGGSTTITDLTLTGGLSNVDIYAMAGSPAGAVTFTLTIAAGAVVWAAAPGTPAIDLSGFAIGSIINIINNGKIIGAGGRGGPGGSATGTGAGNFAYGGADGEAGGTAILLPGSGRTVNITNANGFIFGGGGGGGGGGATTADGDFAANGGGGGGGAGFGRGGHGGCLTQAEGGSSARGSYGTNGTRSTFGTGGSGANSGSATGAAGGNGGDFGAAGSNGTTPTPSSITATGGTGGAAGKAVDLNGGAVTFISGNDATHVKGAVS